MGNKFVEYLMWALLIVALLGVVWLLIEPIIWWTPLSEWRLCIRLFLLMFAANTFATLRLYNSIVQNTRFSIKLREAFGKLTNAIPSLERAMKSLSNSLGSTKGSTDSLKKEVSDNTDAVIKFAEKLHKFNNKN